MAMNPIARKRNNLRQTIRKQHLNSIFASMRSQLHNAHTQTECELLMKKSLVPNGLLEQIRSKGLLRRLSDNSGHAPNMIFTLAVCSNVLLDDLALDEKEAIMELCLAICCQLQTQQNNAEQTKAIVYFYVNSMACYHHFDEDTQIQMEGIYLAHIGRLITMGDLLREHPSIVDDIEMILLQYFTDGENYELYYKVEHNTPLLNSIIDHLPINQTDFAMLWARVSATLQSSLQLHKNRKFISFIIGRMEKNPNSINLCITLSNLLSSDQNAVIETETDFKTIMRSIERAQCTIHHLEALSQLATHDSIRDTLYVGSIVEYLIERINLSDELTLQLKVIQILKSLLILQPAGIAEKSLKNLGGTKMLEDIQNRTLSRQLNQAIAQFWDICLDIQL